MSIVRLSDVLVIALLCCIITTQVSCEETKLYGVNSNGTIVINETYVLNNTAVISFIECVCHTNTSTCSTKANPVTSSGPIQPSRPCNIIDVESSDITYRKSSGILTKCGREDSRTFVTFIYSNNCPDLCLVISFPRDDISLPISDFVNASKQCTDFWSKLSNQTTTLIPKSTDFIKTTKTFSISTSISTTAATKAMTTEIQVNVTTVSARAAGGIPNLTVIISCSILGILAVIIITCIVVIIKRKKSKERLLVNFEKRTPLDFGSGQDGAYSRLSHGYENNEDIHTYQQVQHSSYANENRSGIPNLDYSLPNQAGVSYNHEGHSKKPISLLSRHEEDGAYIEIIDDSLTNPEKLPEYLGIYDKPEERYSIGCSSIYPPVVSSPVTSDDLGHQYLSLKLSDSDGYYIDALSIQTFRKDHN